MNDPQRVALASADRIARLLGHAVSAPLVEKLGGVPRLQRRMAGLILGRLSELGTLDHRQATILAMAPGELADLAVRAGLIWHAGALARMIDGVTRRAFADRFGEAVFRSTLAAAMLAPPEQSAALGVEALAEAAPREGAACLAAWCDIQPPPIAGRLALTRPEASFDARHRALGPAIVTWALDNP